MNQESHQCLIVEDDPLMADHIGRKVRAMGHSFEIVDNRDDGLVLLQRKNYCYVLLDLQIKADPDDIHPMTECGFALLRNLKKRGISFPIIVVSGHAEDSEDIQRAMLEGAKGIFHKPMNSPRNRLRLSAKIEQILQICDRQYHSECIRMSTPSAHEEMMNGTKPAREFHLIGPRVQRRTQVRIDSEVFNMRTKPLTNLLRLLSAEVSKTDRGWVHKLELGGKIGGGFKGRERIIEDIPLLKDFIENDDAGRYRLVPGLIVPGEVNFDVVESLQDSPLMELARSIWSSEKDTDEYKPD